MKRDDVRKDEIDCIFWVGWCVMPDVYFILLHHRSIMTRETSQEGSLWMKSTSFISTWLYCMVEDCDSWRWSEWKSQPPSRDLQKKRSCQRLNGNKVSIQKYKKANAFAIFMSFFLQKRLHESDVTFRLPSSKKVTSKWKRYTSQRVSLCQQTFLLCVWESIQKSRISIKTILKHVTFKEIHTRNHDDDFRQNREEREKGLLFLRSDQTNGKSSLQFPNESIHVSHLTWSLLYA